MPSQPTSLNVLSGKLGIPVDRLGDKMTDMAQRGLLVDLEHNGQRYFALTPVVIGFFEFTFMRVRDDMPMAELARLFDEYFNEDDRFARSVHQGQTQIGRRLVREEALPEGDYAEILDWERASYIIRSAPVIGISLCPCRHELSHLGKACDKPQLTCLSLNYAADTLIRNGIAQPLTTKGAMRVLEECKEAGLAQTADNVQRQIAYICNCCGCCCGMVRALKTFNIRNAIVSSSWIMEVDLAKCNGCGKCAEACPVDAIETAEKMEEKKQRRWAVCAETLCLGCGVCYSACKFGGVTMKPRPQRVFTPETAFDRIVAMAIERGKLANLIFDEPERLSHRALGRIISALEKSPPFKAAMAIRPLRSAFLSTMVKEARKRAGEISDIIG
jgi:Fe-S-cluster-containing hydrogenase component 2